VVKQKAGTLHPAGSVCQKASTGRKEVSSRNATKKRGKCHENRLIIEIFGVAKDKFQSKCLDKVRFRQVERGLVGRNQGLEDWTLADWQAICQENSQALSVQPGVRH
jgi:hypothetical protein